MPTFHYQALDNQGKKHKGFIDAESKARAFSLLRDQNLSPLNLSPAKTRSGGGLFSRLKELLPGRRVRLGESFFYLALLIQSGSALAEALDLLGRMSGGKAGRVWLAIRDAVEAGKPFSKALAEYPRIFPRVYVGMIQVAESVGKLGHVLERVADYEEKRAEVQGRVATALVYPSLIMLVGLGAVYFLLVRVLPDIATIFEDSQQQLPLQTRILLGLGTTLESLGPLIFIPPLVLVLVFISLYRKGGKLRQRVDRFLWRIPLFQKSILARFSGMLGFQLEAGIPLVKGMENAAEAVASTFFRSIIAGASKEVSAGQPLDKVLTKTGIFPDIYLLTLSTGQKAGKLGLFLERLARVMEKEVDNIVKRVMALLEPALILLIGLAVGFIVLAIMGPIFKISTLIR